MDRRTFFLRLALFAACFLPAEAAPNPRGRLEELYARSGSAAGIKFVSGMLKHRAAGFQLYAPDGSRVDLSLERERFRVLFASATRVRFRAQISRLETGPSKVRAHVRQWLTIERVKPETRELYTLVFRSRVVDDWIPHEGDWRLKTSYVLSQECVSEGPLNER